MNGCLELYQQVVKYIQVYYVSMLSDLYEVLVVATIIEQHT